MKVSDVKTRLQEIFSNSFDLVTVEGSVQGNPCIYAFFDGMSDRELLESGIIKPLSILDKKADLSNIGDYLASSSPTKQLESIDEGINEIVSSKILLFIEPNLVYSFDLRKMSTRSVAEPPTSSVLKGPRAGFVEEISINTTLIRRRLQTKDLVIQKLSVGKYTRTTIGLCYISSIADDNLVKEISRRISQIDVDGIIDSSYVAMFIEDNKDSIFSQVATEEKPDIVVAKLLEGRIAIIVDGSPMVITLPYLFLESFQDSEDYFRRPRHVSFVRFLRLLGLILSTLLPAIYVAVQEFQYQLIPLKFMITIINASNGTPFSPTVEMLVVLIIFDILNEASVRMPKYVGMALSIVGAIVLGETAVRAGLLGSPAVLIMALSAIGMYTTPSNTSAFSLLRIIFLISASIFGILGIMIASAVFLCNISTLKSFGVDFTAPYAPIVLNDLKDGFVKKGINDMDTRPESIPNKNKRRKSGE